MSVAFTELPQGRSCQKNNLWQKTFKRAWQGISTSATTDANEVLEAFIAATSVEIGSVYTAGSSTVPGSFVQTIDPQADGLNDGKGWTVTVTYGPYNASTFGSDPTTWPLQFWFEHQKYELPVSRDKDGNAIVNSAGVKYDEPVTVDDSRPILIAERRMLVSAFDRTLAETYRDKVNSGAWNGYAARVAKVAGIDPSRPYFAPDGSVCTTVRYQFELNRDTWDKKILDRGYTKLSGGALARIVDQKNQPVSEPQLLNGSGGQLAVGGTPVFNTYHCYAEVDFAALGIDLSAAWGV